MSKKILIGLTAGIIGCLSSAKAQNDIYAGFRIGSYTYENWKYIEGDIPLSGGMQGVWTAGMNVKRYWNEKWYMKTVFSVLKGRHSVEFSNASSGSGVNHAFYQLTPSVHREFLMTKGKFGLHGGVGLAVNYLNQSNHRYVNDRSFQVIVRKEPDDQGNEMTIPVHDMVLNGELGLKRNIHLFLRPEVGLFLKVGDQGRLTVDGVWGANLGHSVMTRDFDSIDFEGEKYYAKDKVSGNHFATYLGYEFRF